MNDNKVNDQAEKLAFFELKQKFLREIPHPKLIRKQILLLRKKNGMPEEGVALTFSTVKLSDLELNKKLVHFLEDQIKNELQLKHAISMAKTNEDLHDNLVDLYERQVIMLKKLQSYITNCTTMKDEHIKMSQPIDVYTILKTIVSLNLQENEIKPYLCSKTDQNEDEFDPLLTACLRANKIIVHG